MTACIDNCSHNSSTTQFCSDSNQTKLSKSLCRFAKLCKPTFLSDSVSQRSLVCVHSCTNTYDDDDLLWLKIQEEAMSELRQEPILRDHYYLSVLSHVSLESAVANLLATKLGNASLSKNTLFELFLGVMVQDNAIGMALRNDLKAAKERDPACLSHVHCLLNFKGFQASQAHRVSHKLWSQNRTALAVLIQSRVSEVFGVDIHPGAKIGSGLVIDHATGVVIGETAVIGDNVTILHNVTLGGTGKVSGDRHPKIGDGVFIGAGSKILGSIRIGQRARIGAGSVVLKEVPPNATAVGNPARLI